MSTVRVDTYLSSLIISSLSYYTLCQGYTTAERRVRNERMTQLTNRADLRSTMKLTRLDPLLPTHPPRPIPILNQQIKATPPRLHRQTVDRNMPHPECSGPIRL